MNWQGLAQATTKTDVTLPNRWHEVFVPFSIHHLIAVAWCAAIVIGFVIAGRRQKTNPSKEQNVGRIWAIFVALINVWSLAFWFSPGKFNLKESLPLQLCDIACLLAPVCMLWPKRIIRALIYFWGFGLTTQAFFTPTLREGPGLTEYWLFWLVHTGIVGTAVYEVTVRNFRPTFRDLWQVIAISTAVMLSMLGLNLLIDANYWYVGQSSPQNPTIVDKLGPWPGRVGMMSAIATSVFVLLWAFGRSRKNSDPTVSQANA